MHPTYRVLVLIFGIEQFIVVATPCVNYRVVLMNECALYLPLLSEYWVRGGRSTYFDEPSLGVLGRCLKDVDLLV